MLFDNHRRTGVIFESFASSLSFTSPSPDPNPLPPPAQPGTLYSSSPAPTLVRGFYAICRPGFFTPAQPNASAVFPNLGPSSPSVRFRRRVVTRALRRKRSPKALREPWRRWIPEVIEVVLVSVRNAQRQRRSSHSERFLSTAEPSLGESCRLFWGSRGRCSRSFGLWTAWLSAELAALGGWEIRCYSPRIFGRDPTRP